MRKYILEMLLIVCVCVVFCAIALLIPSDGDTPGYSAPVAVILGIFSGFMISNALSRQNSIDELLRTHNNSLLQIYRMSIVFDKKVQDDIQQLVDKYLVEQIDYNLADFRMSEKSFDDLNSYIIGLERSNKKQITVYDHLLKTVNQVSAMRERISAQMNQRISKEEWTITIILSVVTIYTFYTMSDGTLISSVATSAASGGLILILLILRRIDCLEWDQSSWVWQPLHELFRALQLLPYYTDNAIMSGRAKVERGEVVRVAYYKNEYPDMTDKVVKIVRQ